MSLPLPALLSQALVAFTIELDNEFEHRMPHRTTNHASTPGKGPWLVSMAMWLNCMRFVDEIGIKVRELEERAGTKTNLNGMERWGYVIVEPDPAPSAPEPPRSRWIVRATHKGQRARQVWRPLFSEIERRWQARFGKEEIDRLRQSLETLVSQLDPALPDCLPILQYGLFSRGPDRKQHSAGSRQQDEDSSLPLAALLSRALLAFAIEFERESTLSLAISANVVRALSDKGVKVRDLPLLTGISKEAISMATGVLQKRDMIEIVPIASGKTTKVARLTPKGEAAQEAYRQLVGIIEERWQNRFGLETIRRVREPLQRLAAGAAGNSPLFGGLDPYPDGWRAQVSRPGVLPHYPMVLHRGGFPDGS